MQGFNMGRYVPPEFEGQISANKLQGKHALGSRASKINQGILTVRFEMPFPIWCTNCPKPTIIGQGVRFNAEKKKIGNYYSTPIFSFRFKHAVCGGWIEIKTDPKNTAYVVVSGARKRDTGEDRVREGDVEILTEEEREKRRQDAFASLEVKIDDRKRVEMTKRRIEELQDAQSAQWEDPYEQNRKLRAAFRVGRKDREKAQSRAEALQDKLSLGIDLLPENEEDALRAGFIEFGDGAGPQKAIARPLFSDTREVSTSKHKNLGIRKGSKTKLKVQELADKRRADLEAEIRGNTRARIDPFLHDERQPPRVALGIKRKREATIPDTKEAEAEKESPKNDRTTTVNLVDYDSE